MEKGSLRFAVSPEDKERVKKRWGRRFKILGLGVAALCGLALLVFGVRFVTGWGPSADEAEAIDAVFSERGRSVSGYVLQTESEPWMTERLKEWSSHYPPADAAAIKAALASRSPNTYIRPFRSKHHFQRASPFVIEQALDGENAIGGKRWTWLFGLEKGIIRILPTILLPGNRILVVYEIWWGNLGASGSIVECEKVNGKWKITELSHWES